MSHTTSIVHICSTQFRMHLNRNLALLGSLLASFISLALFLYLSNMSVPDMHASNTERNGPGQVVASSRFLRLAMFIIVNILISSCAVFSVVSSLKQNDEIV